MGRRTLSEIVCTQTIFTNRANLRGALALGLLLTAAALASGCSSDAGQPDGGPVCAQGAPDGSVGSCLPGTQCTNGVCVATCDASGNGCSTGFYCESTDIDAGLNVCSPDTATDCQSDNDCPVPQSCAPGGICSSLETRANGSTQGCLLGSVDDGCAPDSLCYQSPCSEGSTLACNFCRGLAHCSEDGGCPDDSTGYGSVCNQEADGGYLFPGKERLCLFGFCVDDTNCPAGAACFYRTPGSNSGQCQDGFPGDPCYTINDCFNSPTGCNVILDGGFDGGEDDGGTLGDCY